MSTPKGTNREEIVACLLRYIETTFERMLTDTSLSNDEKERRKPHFTSQISRIKDGSYFGDSYDV